MIILHNNIIILKKTIIFNRLMDCHIWLDLSMFSYVRPSAFVSNRKEMFSKAENALQYSHGSVPEETSKFKTQSWHLEAILLNKSENCLN
jgi:hypothetical protein